MAREDNVETSLSVCFDIRRREGNVASEGSDKGPSRCARQEQMFGRSGCPQARQMVSGAPHWNFILNLEWTEPRVVTLSDSMK